MQAEAVKKLRAAGVSYADLSPLGGGIPDGIAGFCGTNILVEWKSRGGKLTKAQHAFHWDWDGALIVAETAEEVLKRLGYYED